MLNLNYQPSTRTAEDGGFSLVSRKGKWRLCVCHDLGFATVESGDFEVGQTLKLLPWSVVAGKDLKSVGSQTPVTIALSSPAQAWLSQSGVAIAQYATVNSEGDFEFNRVAPGFTYFIERLDSTQKRLAAPGRYTGRGKTEAGARHQILLGQPGRKVIGELKFDGRRIQAFGFARARVQRPEYPEGFDQWDEARRSQWQEQWSKTEAGMRYQTANWLEYSLKFPDKYHFEIDALPPGFYEISINLGTDRGDSYHRNRKLHVKKIAADQKDPQPQDLGVIEFVHP